jgi:hypothetical protein
MVVMLEIAFIFPECALETEEIFFGFAPKKKKTAAIKHFALIYL